MKKIVIVTNIPNPYRIPLFNAVYYKLISQGNELTVVFSKESYKRRKFILDLNDCKFPFIILSSPTLTIGGNEKTIFLYKGLLRTLLKLNPDKIIVSGFSIATFKLWALSYFKKIDFIIWAGSVKARTYSFFKTISRKLLIKRAKGFIVYGSKAKEYLKYLGAPENQITISFNTVDTDFFSREVEKIKKSMDRTDHVKHLTVIGDLIALKDPKQILKIAKDLLNTRTDFVIDFIGDGDLKSELIEYVRINDMEKYIKFHGYIQKKYLPNFLAQSDCFLFNTNNDIWGLVLNEAMASGIPCITTFNAGAAFDIIKEGVNGFIVDFSNSSLVIEKINFLLNNKKEAEKMGQNGKEFILKNVSIDASSGAFVQAALK